MNDISEDVTDERQRSWMVNYHVYDGQHDGVDFHWSNHRPSLVVEETYQNGVSTTLENMNTL